MNVTLTKELEGFVKSKVRGGGYANASAVVREALRILQRQECCEDPHLEAYLLEAARQPQTPLTHADFKRVRRRGLARLLKG